MPAAAGEGTVLLVDVETNSGRTAAEAEQEAIALAKMARLRAEAEAKLVAEALAEEAARNAIREDQEYVYQPSTVPDEYTYSCK